MNRDGLQLLHFPENSPMAAVVVQIFGGGRWAVSHPVWMCTADTLNMAYVSSAPRNLRSGIFARVGRIDINVNRQTLTQLVEFAKNLPGSAPESHAALPFRRRTTIDKMF